MRRGYATRGEFNELGAPPRGPAPGARDNAPTRTFANVSLAVDADTWTQLLETMTRDELVAFVRQQVTMREAMGDRMIQHLHTDHALQLAHAVNDGNHKLAAKLAKQIIAHQEKTR